MRLPVVRFALVILCLPRTDGSEPFTGCQENAADDFFSTDLSSDLFPHNGYVPDGYHPTRLVPDEACDLTISPGFEASYGYQPHLAMVAPWYFYLVNHLTAGTPKFLKQTICVQPGTCEWPPFEPRSHLNLRILLTACLAPCSVRHGLYMDSDWPIAFPDAHSKGSE